jgi:hypothetical protein
MWIPPSTSQWAVCRPITVHLPLGLELTTPPRTPGRTRQTGSPESNDSNHGDTARVVSVSSPTWRSDASVTRKPVQMRGSPARQVPPTWAPPTLLPPLSRGHSLRSPQFPRPTGSSFTLISTYRNNTSPVPTAQHPERPYFGISGGSGRCGTCAERYPEDPMALRWRLPEGDYVSHKPLRFSLRN